MRASIIENLLQKIARYFSPPVFDDPEKNWRAAMVYRMLEILILGAFVQTSLLYAIVESPIPAISNASMILFYWGGLVLVRRGWVEFVGAGITVVIWLHVTGSMFGFGGLESPAVLMYPLCVLVAGFLWSVRAAFGIASLSLLAGLLAGWMDANGMLPANLQPLTRAAFLVAMFISLALASAMLAFALGHLQSAVRAIQVRDLDLDQKSRALHLEGTRRRRAEEWARTLIEQAPVGIAVIDEKGYCKDVNPALLQIMGAPSAEDVLGGNLWESTLYLSSDELRESMERLFERGERATLEISWVTPWERVIGVRMDLAPLRSRAGEIEGALVLAEDITERMSLEEQLRHSQKMEAIGTLAGGVAHDFNNYLAVIHGCAELLSLEFPEGHSLRPIVAEIGDAARQSAMLTRQLLAFSRKQVFRPQLISLNEIVTNTEKMLRRLLGEGIELEAVLSADIGAVRSDPSQVEQVVMNLVVNARDSMRNGGLVTIETSNIEIDDAYAELHPEVFPGQFVMLAVSDTGTGISDDIRTRIFDPFFTTKAEGHGTGLGLSTVYGIVKQSSGCILVYSEDGRGSTFKVLLPRVEFEEATEGVQPEKQPIPHGSETILIAEDERPVRTVARTQLERYGYTVLEAEDGERALEVVSEHEGEINLLLTDVMMPRMGGPTLIARLREAQPELPVVYMTGYTETEVSRHARLEDTATFLKKPFTMDLLLRKVRESLDASSEA